MTLGEKLATRTTGFDYLRLVLAAGVLMWHSLAITTPSGPAWDAARPLWTFILPAFFALSGFLVAGSLERSRLDTFLTLRAMRIVPALAVEVALSAFLLGPLVTTFVLSDYFKDPRVGRYFLNIVGNIQYELPGVFSSNTFHQVNLSLWTVPFELECYAALAALALLGLHRRRRLFLAVAVAAWLIVPLTNLHDTFGNQSNIGGRSLVTAFLAGSALYLWRDRIPQSKVLFAICFGLTLFLMSIPVVALLAIWPAAYVTVYLGALNPPRSPLISTGDYSYGVYLFAFPIQQALWLSPLGKGFFGNCFLALALCLAYAAFSWHCVEKPILSRRATIMVFVNGLVDRMLRILSPTKSAQT